MIKFKSCFERCKVLKGRAKKRPFLKCILISGFQTPFLKITSIPTQNATLMQQKVVWVQNCTLFFISSSGKSFLMNMALHPLETTRAPPNSNWNASMCTTTRLLEANTCHEPSSWIWSLAPWTRSGLALMAKFSGLITLSLDNQELETIGPRDITPKVCVWYYLL